MKPCSFISMERGFSLGDRQDPLQQHLAVGRLPLDDALSLLPTGNTSRLAKATP